MTRAAALTGARDALAQALPCGDDLAEHCPYPKKSASVCSDGEEEAAGASLDSTQFRLRALSASVRPLG